MIELADSQAWWWLGSFSVITFVGSLMLMPWIVLRMPANYFTRRHRDEVRARRQGSALVFFLMIARSVLGFFVFLAGVAMLVLPGQGILTILIGIGLMEFPGKFALECRLASQSTVFRALNWIRRKGAKPDFLPPEVD